MNVWNYLLYRANIESYPTNYTWKRLAIYLESVKLLRIQFTKGFTILLSGTIPISKYDKIRFYSNRKGSRLYGDILSVLMKGDSYEIIPLNGELLNETFPIIKSDTLIRDINIRGINLLDYVDGSLSYIN